MGAATRRCSPGTSSARRLRAGLCTPATICARQGSSLPKPAFLDMVPIRFGMAERGALSCAAARLALWLLDLPGELRHGQGHDPQRDALHSQRRGMSRFADVAPDETLLDFLRLDGVRCAAPRKAAPRAIAAPAPCWSGGSRPAGWSMKASTPASASSARSTARHVVTVEHLRGADGQLHPVQQAMVDFHGSQCGFCTPGFVMSLYGLWMKSPRAIERRDRKGAAGQSLPLHRLSSRSSARRAPCPAMARRRTTRWSLERKAIDGDGSRRCDDGSRVDDRRRARARLDRAGRRRRSCRRPRKRACGHARRRLDRCRPVGHQVHARDRRR